MTEAKPTSAEAMAALEGILELSDCYRAMMRGPIYTKIIGKYVADIATLRAALAELEELREWTSKRAAGYREVELARQRTELAELRCYDARDAKVQVKLWEKLHLAWLEDIGCNDMQGIMDEIAEGARAPLNLEEK